MIIDAHCDVLAKLYAQSELRFDQESDMDVTMPRLKRANVLMQLFAIYIPQSISAPSIQHIYEYIHIFNTRIVKPNSEIQVIRNAEHLRQSMKSGKIGAMLTLEGADALQGHVGYVETLFELGVRSLQMTWNYGNWAADGVLEPRQAGLTLKGKELVKACARTGMILDVSHLAERGFWEAAELYGKPFIASHANAYSVCKHPRNLTDEQIRALIDADGRIGITFVPYFVSQVDRPSIDHLLRHIEHVCALGGERHVMFGSDFDGIDRWIVDLEHAGKWTKLKEALQAHYSSSLADDFLWRNAFTFFERTLP